SYIRRRARAAIRTGSEPGAATLYWAFGRCGMSAPSRLANPNWRSCSQFLEGLDVRHRNGRDGIVTPAKPASREDSPSAEITVVATDTPPGSLPISYRRYA